MGFDEKLSTVIEQGRQTIEELRQINKTLKQIEELLRKNLEEKKK